MNAILYLLRSGCAWRLLPTGRFPPCETVYGYFRKWLRERAFGSASTIPCGPMSAARRGGMHPIADSLDSQSVKSTALAGDKGYDAGKKIQGRKRHILFDTLGLLLVVVVTSAAVQDRDGAKLVLRRLTGSCKNRRLVWVDGGATGTPCWIGCANASDAWRSTWCCAPEGAKGFTLLPRRRAVERTFACLYRLPVPPPAQGL